MLPRDGGMNSINLPTNVFAQAGISPMILESDEVSIGATG